MMKKLMNVVPITDGRKADALFHNTLNALFSKNWRTTQQFHGLEKLGAKLRAFRVVSIAISSC